MSLDLDNLLANMAREGRLESSGAFTIDLAAAQKKLALYTLPDSRGYILKMVQAAVAGQARELHLDSRERSVEVRILGLELEQEGLEMLLFRLAESGKALPRSSYHLAVGIRAALGLESDEIIIRSCNGRHEKRIVWARDSIKHEVVESREPVQTVVLFTRTRRRFWRELTSTLNSRDFIGMLRGEPSGYNEEQKLVNDLCCLAPLKISINGKLVPRLSELPYPVMKDANPLIAPVYPHFREVFYPTPYRWRGLQTSEVTASRGFLAPFKALHPATFGDESARLWNLAVGQFEEPWLHLEFDQIIGLHPALPESELMVILDGVLIKRSPIEGGFSAIISADALTTDLTGFQIVENDVYSLRCKVLQDTVEHLVALKYHSCWDIGSSTQPQPDGDS